ncbi:hypothetical protein [Phaeodactylibacter xiamenensis]|uniref:hypothetical protein n=1 Tax=Phaeodactylibacter xiamenensis TaxID=1524460 RepID=UPI0024A8D51E|nr:hypothetical protein [Phaeodactylibacter xiamenensis]
MNFLLRKLENEVPESALLEGEALLEDGAVEGLHELEKQLWIAQSEGFEVEVQLSGQKVSAGTCECGTFKKSGICGHLTGTLLQVRQRQQQQKEKREQKKKATDNPQRLTTGVVLDQVDPAELIGFVREYARTNRNFAIALKARFASSVSNLNSKEKYLQLLDTTINAVRKSDRQITLRGAQRLSKVLDELHQQMEQHLEAGNLVELADIALSIIEKISPVLSKIQQRREQVRSRVEGAFDYLLELVERSPAPQLLRRLWADCQREYPKRTYQSNQLDRYFFKLMLKTAQESSQLEALLGTLEERASQEEEKNGAGADYILLQIAVLEQLDRVEKARKLIEAHLTSPDILEFAIKQAQRQNNRPREKALAQIGLRLDLPEDYKDQLEALLLQLAEAEADLNSIKTYALLQFFRKLDLQFYKKAREATPKTERPALFENTLAQLRQRPYSAELRNTLAGLLLAEEQWAILMAYTEEVQSLDLLGEVDETLLSRFPERVKQLYRQLLHEYARHYVGPKTARRIALALRHLQSLNAQKFVSELAQELREQYPERHTLTAELSAFEE